MFGTLSTDGFWCDMYDNANAGSFIDHHLMRNYTREGRFVMFLDNASYHKSAKIQRFLEEMDGEIILEYLLPYTPQLNPGGTGMAGHKRKGCKHIPRECRRHDGTHWQDDEKRRDSGCKDVRISDGAVASGGSNGDA